MRQTSRPVASMNEHGQKMRVDGVHSNIVRKYLFLGHAKFRVSRYPRLAAGDTGFSPKWGAFAQDSFYNCHPRGEYSRFFFARNFTLYADCKKCIIDTQEPRRPAVVEFWSSGQLAKRLACIKREVCVYTHRIFLSSRKLRARALDGGEP